ncbi:MAG TPA: Kazal-type serine protease inhibitor family protein, partial [Chitinophagales bacterium]|nr:Kazal-type serine protease inhibitor family protein [Chitinophagales bacterium]
MSAFACNDVFDLDNYVTDANGNPVIGGIWSGGTFISADGIFDPSGLSPGDFTLTIDVIMPNGCPSTATLLVKIANPLAPLAVEPNLNICIDNGLVDLSKLVLPQSGFGVWKGTGVNSVTNQFNPAVVGAGNSVNLTYEPVCNNTTLIDANFPCVTDYSPVCGCDGITYNNPCEAEKKGGVINYTAGPCNLISGGIGGCPQNSQTLTVNIGALPVALLNPPLGVLCNNGGQSFDLDDLIAVGSDLNGVWSISPSVSLSAGNILNPDSLTAGNYTVTYIVAATPPCTEPSSAAQTITIETVSINAGTDFTICGLATSITALGDTNGKWTVTSTPSGTAVVSFATPLALTSDVLVNEPGLYAFTRSATSAGGCI